ncbi:MAG: tyrosine--tRNA ligase [Candidatus Gracilibacteria bacterium]|nr:tyrosine--tRNA ligase [Candidatus Gracilibacteria bacterium]
MENRDKIIDNLLKKGVSRVIDEENLRKRLTSGKKLRIKLGIDPTGSVIHIGHAVPILKLKAFQDLGHQVVLIIGDSTAEVGDTSDKNAERPLLTKEEIKENYKNYINMFSKILDIDKVEVRYNSEWLSKIDFNGVGHLAKNFSVAEMLDRDNFSKRYKGGVRISLQEFLYPLMQGYDSIAVEADVELGGNDQYFNLLAGRRLQEAYGQEKQDVMMFNLIEGTDGRKMSKTYHNFIGLDESANNMFVKVMEIKDELILTYFEHCTDMFLEDIEQYKTRLESGENPREVKIDLAKTIVTLYFDEDAAQEAYKYFEKVLKEGLVPDEKDIEKVELEDSELPLVSLIRQAGMVNNSTEARNALNSNGVKVNNEKQTDAKFMVKLDKENYTLLQVGKKKFKLVKQK